MAPSVARESTLHCKLDSQLHGAAGRYMLSVEPEVDNGNSRFDLLPGENKNLEVKVFAPAGTAGSIKGNLVVEGSNVSALQAPITLGTQ